MKIAIFTDSGCNNYQEPHHDYHDIFVASLQVIDNDHGYRDGLDISSQQTYDKLKQGTMLKTSLPLVQDIYEQFEAMKQQGYDFVFAVNITSGLSSTHQTVAMVAQDVGIEYDSFDCYSTAYIQLECALAARDLFKQGASVQQVKEHLAHMCENAMTFVVPVDMNHLVRGGRLTAMAAKLAGLLKIVPILYLDQSTQGKIESYKKVRTFAKALSTMVDAFVEKGIDSTYRICVAHVLALDSAKQFVELLKQRLPDVDCYITDLVSVVGVHTGLGCLACQMIKKGDQV